mmetsp:Transcript_8838/g.18842  ORF Transcript_8838/g.18842 Transcript_8838/m.18842 type:complete len:306 (+) Transcript_8838:1693-2610(+)
MFEEVHQPLVRAVIWRNAFHKNGGRPKQRLIYEPPEAAFKEIPLCPENKLLHDDHHIQGDRSVHPVEPTTKLHVGHADLVEIVAASSVPTEDVVEGAHDKDHRRSDPQQYPDAEVAELDKHGSVQARSALYLVDGDRPGSGRPAKEAFPQVGGRTPCEHIVLVNRREAAAQAAEGHNAHHQDDEAKDQCAVEGMQVPAHAHSEGDVWLIGFLHMHDLPIAVHYQLRLQEGDLDHLVGHEALVPQWLQSLVARASARAVSPRGCQRGKHKAAAQPPSAERAGCPSPMGAVASNGQKLNRHCPGRKR